MTVPVITFSDGFTYPVNTGDLDRFLSKIERPDSGCWLWTGWQFSGTGYAGFGIGGRSILGHRFAYQVLIGAIDDGLHLDHLCRVRHCVNPAHLEPVTPRENTMRSAGPSAVNARKTHCPRGHEYSPENTYRTPEGGRHCKACGSDKAHAKRLLARGGAPDCGHVTERGNACRRPLGHPGQHFPKARKP